MKFISILILIFSVVIIVFSCSQGYIINRNEVTKYPQGRDLFASKCSGCHKLPYPSKFKVSQWDSILVPMKIKAKLTDGEQLMILNWLKEKRSINAVSKNN